jgi:Phage tail tube protein
MTSNSYWGVGKEATYGTAASVSTFTPIGSPKLAPNLKYLDDSDFRGSPVMHYDQVPGVRTDVFDGKTFLYTDVFPNLIVAALGGPDSVASSVHTIGLLNSPNTGSQPPSYTIINDSVDNTYQVTGSRLVDLSLSFAVDAAVEATFKFTGNAASIVASVTANESVQHLIPAWNCAASLGGQAITVVEGAKLDIKRSTAPIWTLGSQQPYNNFASSLDVTGTMDFVVESGQSWWADALVRDPQQLILKFIDPVTNYYIQFQCSTVQLEDPVVEQSKAFVGLSTKFVAMANVSDATSAGYSPIKAVVSNNIAQAY